MSHRTSTSTTSTSIITVFYSNITKWGKKVHSFLAKDRSSVVMFVEHHLDVGEFAQTRDSIRACKRAIYVSYARRQGVHRDSTSGGQIILPMGHLETTDVDKDLLQHCIPRDQFHCPRWTCCVLRTRGVSVLLISLYLFTGQGLSELNMGILQQIFMLVAFFKGVVVILGDWQVTPQEIMQLSAISRLRLSVITPSCVDATCNSGSGRIIDFGVVSSSISQYITLEPELKVPWKSHIGLRLSMPARLRALSAPAIRVPRPLPQLETKDGLHQLDSKHWEDADTIAADFIRRRSQGTGILSCNSTLLPLFEDQQLQLSRQLCSASTRLEVYHCLQAGIADKDMSRYMGRGGLPHAAVSPVVSRNFADSRYACQCCDLWDMIITLLVWLLRYADKQLSGVSTKIAIIELKSLAPRVTSSWFRLAAPNAPPHAWVQFIEAVCFEKLEHKRRGFTVDRLKIWIERAGAQKRAAISANKAKLRRSFRRWLREDLANGGAGAHKLVSKEASFDNGRSKDLIQGTFDSWSALWKAKQPQGSPVNKDGLLTTWVPWSVQLKDFVLQASPHGPQQMLLSDFRAAVASSRSDLAPLIFTADQLRTAARSYPAKKACGADAWNSGQLRVLPLECLEPHASVLTNAHNALLWPIQIMLNLMSLIPKSAGGERTVAKTTLLYRLWNVLRAPEMRNWSAESVASWDYAAAGRSAIASAAIRGWANEVSIISGHESTTVLWDLHKFFDTINGEHVLNAGIDQAYPATDLALGLSMHFAPRCVQLTGIASHMLFPQRSILAGCSRSVDFARLAIRKPIDKVVAQAPSPALAVSTFVDDVAQSSRGSMRTVADASIRAALAFCQGMRQLSLIISDKSVVVSTQPRLARALAHHVFLRTGVTVKVAACARDLGVLNNPTGRRNTSLQGNRLAKSKARLARIAPLAKAVRAARNLVTTGAFPQALWGAASMGLAPSALAKLKSQSAAATGINAAGRCASTAIALAFGERADPQVAAVSQQVSLWMDIWKADSGLRALSTRHWSVMVNRVLRDSIGHPLKQSAWNSVFGQMGATIAMMTDQQWDVTNPALWKDPDGNGWIPDVALSKKPFVDLVEHFAVRKVWQGAAKHWNGCGLESGVDWTATLALHGQLTKSAEAAQKHSDQEGSAEADVLDYLIGQETWHAHSLSWLELLLTGGYWPSQRAAEVHPISPRCPRCGGPYEDAAHLIWNCRANSSIQDERVQETQDLVAQARDGMKEYPCFWLRGILPKGLIPVCTPFSSECELDFVGDPPAGLWPPGTFFTDASGGPHASYKLLRRCGIGIAMLQLDAPFFSDHALNESPMVWGAFGPLPGNVQTVPRAELFAMLTVVRMLMPGKSVIKTDSKVNSDLYASGMQACLGSANGDLWTELFSRLGEGRIVLEITWIKGHAEQEDVFRKYDVQPVDLVGNLVADALANRAADTYKVWEQDAFTVKWYYSVTRRVQARAVCIFTECLESRQAFTPQVAKVPRPLSLSTTAEAMQSQHKFMAIGSTLHCYVCHQHSSSEPLRKLEWLKSPCVPDIHMARTVYFAATKPMKVPQGKTVSIGRAQLHESHSLSLYKGLYFCANCGYNASAKAQKLRVECGGMTTKAAKDRVMALLRGKLPSGMSRWPNEQCSSDVCLLYERTGHLTSE